MKSVQNVRKLSAVTLIGLFASSLGSIPSVKADNDNMITICHGAGLSGTTHFQTLTISSNAVYQEHGQGGHFYENGTQQAGHETDYFGACLEASASPSPSLSPSASPSVSPSVSPSISPSPTPTATPVQTPTPTGDSSDNSKSNEVEEVGDVLGVYAETGVVEDVIMNALGSLGGLMTTIGSVLYGKKKNKLNR